MIRRIISAFVAISMTWSSTMAVTLPQLEREKEKREAQPPVVEEEEEPERVEPPKSLEGPIDPDKYVLGPSDELVLILRGPETVTHTLRVLPEGNVILPNFGILYATGLTLTDFRSKVRTSLRRYYLNVKIECELVRPRMFVVHVLGQVEEPGPVEMVAPFRLSQAIAVAGDITDKGSARLIEIREEGKPTEKVDLFSFWRLGDYEHNPCLREGQTVYVPPKRQQIEVVGEVKLPGFLEVIPGETVADVMRFVGGLSARGDSTAILLERVEAGEIHPVVTFPLDEADQHELRDMDVIVVKDIVSFGGYNPVQVIGGGGRTGIIFVDEGQKLRDFLLRLWRFSPEYHLETAVVERDVSGEKPVQITFDVRAVLEGDPIGETMVLPGDIIMFPPFEENVFVAGEVVTPGPVPFQAGFTAERYVALAGGPNRDGSFNKIKIYSGDGGERKAERNSPVYRGETIVVGRRTSRTIGTFFIALATTTSFVLSVIALINTVNNN